jgi:hypothetical protein
MQTRSDVKDFVLRIEEPLDNGRAMSMMELAFGERINWEEWETIKEAEARAKALRKQGASVELYRLL